MMVIRYFPLIASAAFLAADSFPVSATYHKSSLQVFSNSQINFSNLSQFKKPPTLIPFQKNNFEQLDFSPEQKLQIQQIYNNHQKASAREQQKLQIAQQELVKLIEQDDLASIRNKHQEILQLRQSLERMNFESFLALRAVLTTSQRQKCAEIIESRQIKSQQN